MKSGQVLVIVLLIVVVSLAVGLSVASRNITNLRTSTQTEHSQRAFTAAEGGVEEVLSRLSDVAGNPGVNTAAGANVPVQVGDITAEVNVKGSTVYDAVIEEGTVGQVDLSGGNAPSQVKISWAKSSDPLEVADPASIEVTIVYNSPVGDFTQERSAWSGGGHTIDEEGFDRDLGCPPASGFETCARVNVNAAANPLFMRIRVFWNKATVNVEGVDKPLPVQAYELTSTAATDLGITRKVNVTRTVLPQLPAVFDYVLFSQGDIVK